QQEDSRLGEADLAGGKRPGGGARDSPVDVAVEDVVYGAAGRTHQYRADAEEEVEQPGGPGVGRGITESNRPPTGEQQQPGANRPVEAGEAQVRPRGGRRPAQHPVVAADVARGGGPA